MADFSGRDLAWLERRRAELFALISQVGDFRRGALNAVWRKCGKPNCACAQPGHRGHGPQWNLTRRVGGKTVNVHLKPGPELDKARAGGGRAPAVRRPGGGGERGQRGDLRGQAGGRGGAPSGGGGKGGLPARLAEIAAAEVGRLAGLAAGMLGAGAALGVLEQAMRAALAAAGARLLEAVLAGDDGYCRPARRVRLPATRPVYAGSRPKTVTTVLGPVQVSRAWYHCRECERGFAPRDEQLGVAGTSLSPGLAEMIARAGAEVSFGRAAALLAGLAGVAVSARTIERSAEASGAAARGGRRRRGRRAARPGDRPAAPARAGPGHAVCRGRRHRRAGPRQRDRGPAGQGRGRQGRDPRDQARPALHRVRAWMTTAGR